jgi:hypothetical protein
MILCIYAIHGALPAYFYVEVQKQTVFNIDDKKRRGLIALYDFNHN